MPQETRRATYRRTDFTPLRRCLQRFPALVGSGVLFHFVASFLSHISSTQMSIYMQVVWAEGESLKLDSEPGKRNETSWNLLSDFACLGNLHSLCNRPSCFARLASHCQPLSRTPWVLRLQQLMLRNFGGSSTDIAGNDRTFSVSRNACASMDSSTDSGRHLTCFIGNHF